MELECPDLAELSNGEHKLINVRYGVVAYNDMLRDLSHWESLISATFMQRPHTVLTPDKINDQILEAQKRNITSALAFAALSTDKENATEHDLYETIV